MKKDEIYIPFPGFPKGDMSVEHAFEELSRFLLFTDGYCEEDMLKKYKSLCNKSSITDFTENEKYEIIYQELRMKYDKSYRKFYKYRQRSIKLDKGIKLFKIFNFDIILKRRK